MAAYTTTAYGAPRSGRFAVGDTVTDGQGIIWSCVRATSPRQWIPINNPLSTGATLASKTGLSVQNLGDAAVSKTILTLAADTSFTITNANAYLGTKLYTFPEGLIYIIGSVASLQFAVPGDRTATTGGINVDASLTWAVGTATASNKTLATTMVDIIAKQTKVIPTGSGYTTVSQIVTSTPVALDGTGGAKDMYLNFGFETDTDIDNDAVLYAKGTITLLWALVGDF